MRIFIKKDNLGITLIALVVTIIILLILAGVTIGLATNGTGLFDKAKLATDEYNNSVDGENYELAKSTNRINELVNGSRDYELEINSLKERIDRLESNNSKPYTFLSSVKGSASSIDISSIEFNELYIEIAIDSTGWTLSFNIPKAALTSGGKEYMEGFNNTR